MSDMTGGVIEGKDKESYIKESSFLYIFISYPKIIKIPNKYIVEIVEDFDTFSFWGPFNEFIKDTNVNGFLRIVSVLVLVPLTYIVISPTILNRWYITSKIKRNKPQLFI